VLYQVAAVAGVAAAEGVKIQHVKPHGALFNMAVRNAELSAAIARAVAKDPRILILDDALSAVDTYTEAEILRRMRGVMRERTSIVVAHRISTVKDADEIVVLDDGRIVERGSHRDLLEHGGLYAQMYRRQLLEEELEVDEEREEHEKRVKAQSEEGPRLGMRPRLGGIGGEP